SPAGRTPSPRPCSARAASSSNVKQTANGSPTCGRKEFSDGMVEIQRVWVLRVGVVPGRLCRGGDRDHAAALPPAARAAACLRRDGTEMKPRHRRMIWIAAGLAALGVATALVLNAFNSNLVFFYTPTQIATGEAPKNKHFRLGGMVEDNSLKRAA